MIELQYGGVTITTTTVLATSGYSSLIVIRRTGTSQMVSFLAEFKSHLRDDICSGVEFFTLVIQLFSSKYTRVGL